MSSKQTFEKARSSCSRALIESLAPGGEWREDGDYWPCSPLRADSKPGSFHISPAGLWHDFATGEGGDIIKLVELMHGIKPMAAAEWILAQTGQAPEPKAKREKAGPVFPIPEEAKHKLNELIAKSPRGAVGGGWRYHDAKGGWVFAVVRFNAPDGGKDVIPYYYDGARWHEGQAMSAGRPLYRLHELSGDSGQLPVLIVEGEKCASVKVPGFIVTTWSGGASAVAKTDFGPLVSRDVTIWPDADAPGMKAALQIKGLLPQAEILNIQGKPEGWDIADCDDPSTFLAECPRITDAPPEPVEPLAPFRCLGYDESYYHFILGGQRQTYQIPKGGFTTSKLAELAPPEWWASKDCLSDKGAIDLTAAQILIIKMQTEAGMFDPAVLRGAGVWLDGADIVINDGQRIVELDGKVHDLTTYEGDSVYVRSAVRFGDMAGSESTVAEGQALNSLMLAQGWSRYSDAVAALGWSLIAPFGGLLKFRPHIWITGRRGSGKTYVLDNIIRELVGPFGHDGSGKDTEAGIRRTLNMDARPVALDEMEPKSKPAREQILKILDLARNASSDGSGRVTMADGKGTQSFLIRSCFCFASINTVVSEGAAIASRIISCELKAPEDQDAEKDKIARSKDLYKKSMRDAGRFRRRIFRALPRIMEDIEALREMLPEHLGGAREADLWAPIFAAAWAVQSDESIMANDGQAWLLQALYDEQISREKNVEDEDRVVSHILESIIESDGKYKKTVAEWLTLAGSLETGHEEANELLQRYGLKVVKKNDGRRTVAIVTQSSMLSRLLAGTPYEGSYDAQIRRNRLCIEDKTTQARMGDRNATVRELDWDGFKVRYLGDGGAA